jgi:hypothetical protein
MKLDKSALAGSEETVDMTDKNTNGLVRKHDEDDRIFIPVAWNTMMFHAASCCRLPLPLGNRDVRSNIDRVRSQPIFDRSELKLHRGIETEPRTTLI